MPKLSENTILARFHNIILEIEINKLLTIRLMYIFSPVNFGPRDARNRPDCLMQEVRIVRQRMTINLRRTQGCHRCRHFVFHYTVLVTQKAEKTKDNTKSNITVGTRTGSYQLQIEGRTIHIVRLHVTWFTNRSLVSATQRRSPSRCHQ